MAKITGNSPQLGVGTAGANLSFSDLRRVYNVKVLADDSDEVSMGDMRDFFRTYGMDPGEHLPDTGDTIKLSEFENCTTFGGWIFMRNETASTYSNNEDAAIAFHHFPYGGSGALDGEDVGMDSSYEWRIQGDASAQGAPACDTTYVMNSSWGAATAVPLAAATNAVFDSIGVPGIAPTRVRLLASTAGTAGNGLSITGFGGTPPTTGAITKAMVTTPWTPGTMISANAAIEGGGTASIQISNADYGEITSGTIAGDGTKTFSSLIADNNASNNDLEIVTGAWSDSGVGSLVPAVGVSLTVSGSVVPVTSNKTGTITANLGTDAYNGESIVGNGVLTCLELTVAKLWDPLGLEVTGTFNDAGGDILAMGQTITLNGGVGGSTVTTLVNQVAGLTVTHGGSESPLEGEVLTTSGGLNVGDDTPGTGGHHYGTFGRNDAAGHSVWNGTQLSNGIEYTLTCKQIDTGGEFDFSVNVGYTTAEVKVEGPDGTEQRNIKWSGSNQGGGLNSSWSDNFLVYNGLPHASGDTYGLKRESSQHYWNS